MKILVEALGRLPAGFQSAIGGSRLDKAGHVLKPEVAMFLRLMGDTELSRPQNNPIDKVRLQTSHDAWVFGGDDQPLYLEQSFTIKGRDCNIPLKYYAVQEHASGVLLYFHGGAWVSGDIGSCECVCRCLARKTGLPVLSVDYRLAPEHPYPAAIEDAISAYEYVLNNMRGAEQDGFFIAVGGDSAGGNIAAALCLAVKARSWRLPDFQLLFYPVMDNQNRSQSYDLFQNGYVLTADQMNWARHLYVPSANYQDPLVSPLLAEDFAGLPDAYIASAEFDVLRDEGEAYANKLRQAGACVTLRRATGLIHGYANMMGVSRSARAEMTRAADTLFDAYSKKS